MQNIADKLTDLAHAYVGKPSSHPELACIFLVLDILAPLSGEFAVIRERLKRLEVGAAKRTLIEQDYFFKFIRTTRLKLLPIAEGKLPLLAPGDVLLLNKRIPNGKVDHLGLYLGQGAVISLGHQGKSADIMPLAEIRNQIKAIARGKLDG